MAGAEEEEDIDAGLRRIPKNRILTCNLRDTEEIYLFIKRDIEFLHIMLDEVFCHMLKNG